MTNKEFEKVIKTIAVNISGDHIYDFCFDEAHNPLLYVVDRSDLNPYSEIIVNNAYIGNRTNTNIKLMNVKDVDEFSELIQGKLKRRCVVYVFWLLMIMAVDSENYNKNLNLVSEIICKFDISELELLDLIKVVKSVLSGEGFKSIEYKAALVKFVFSKMPF